MSKRTMRLHPPDHLLIHARRLLRRLPLTAALAAFLALLTSVPGAVAEASSPPTSRYQVVSPGPSTVSSRDLTPYRVLFVGASITAGVGARSPDDGYANEVAGDVARKIHRPVAMSVVARPGAVVGMAQSWHVPGGQRMIVVHLVTNDFLKSTPLTRYAVSEKHLLQRLRKGSPHAVIYCLGSWADPGDTNRAGITASAYDTQVQADCRGVHGTYVELGPLFDEAALHGDSPRPTLAGPQLAFHPNQAGHVQIADAIMRQIPADALPQETHEPSPGPSSPSPVAASAASEPEEGPQTPA